WLVIADVVQPIRGIRFSTAGRWGDFHNPHHALYDVIDVGEVPQHLAVIEDFDWLSLDDGLDELEQCHVRPPPGAVHRKETQPGKRQAVKMGIHMSHELVALLGGGIQAYRMINVVLL